MIKKNMKNVNGCVFIDKQVTTCGTLHPQIKTFWFTALSTVRYSMKLHL